MRRRRPSVAASSSPDRPRTGCTLVGLAFVAAFVPAVARLPLLAFVGLASLELVVVVVDLLLVAGSPLSFAGVLELF